MITLNLKGGLGNQLFQISALISHAIRYGKSFIIPYTKYLNCDDTKRLTYWDTLLNNIKPYTSGHSNFANIDHINELLLLKHPVYTERSFNYTSIDEDIDNVVFNGYFQSYKYFNEHKEKLILLYNIAHQQILTRGEHFNYLNKCNIASMHFRIGDYKPVQNIHPILNEVYYDKALSRIPDDYRILIFSEKQDRDDVDIIVNALKTKHKHEFVYVSDDIEDWKQMLLMSLCRINIIANSTFSWWGAYFNKDAYKVYYPSLWFGNDFQGNTNDLFLPEWEKIEL